MNKYILKIDTNKVYSDLYQITGHGIFPVFQNKVFGKSNMCICNEFIGNETHVLKTAVNGMI